MDAKETVLQTLRKAGKALKGGEIAEISGLDKKSVDKAIKQLQIQNLIEVPKRCYYVAK